jgi:hypothetical protein
MIKKPSKSRDVSALKIVRKASKKTTNKTIDKVAHAEMAQGDSRKLLAQISVSKIYILVCYFLIASTVCYFSYLSYQTYLEKKRTEMSEVAYEIEMNFINTLSYAESTLNHINRQIANSKKTNAAVAEILTSFNTESYSYNSIKDVLSVGMFYWVDANKFLVASSAGPIISPIDLANRDYLEFAKNDPNKIHTGSPIVGASSGQRVIPAGVALVSKNGAYVGTSVVSFKIDNLVEKFKRLAGHYQTDFAILDDSNKVLIESERGMFSKNVDLLKKLNNEDASLREETITEFDPLNSDGSYVMLRNVRGYPYKILVSYENKVLLSYIQFENLPNLIELLIFTSFFVMIWIIFPERLRRKS